MKQRAACCLLNDATMGATVPWRRQQRQAVISKRSPPTACCCYWCCCRHCWFASSDQHKPTSAIQVRHRACRRVPDIHQNSVLIICAMRPRRSSKHPATWQAGAAGHLVILYPKTYQNRPRWPFLNAKSVLKLLHSMDWRSSSTTVNAALLPRRVCVYIHTRGTSNRTTVHAHSVASILHRVLLTVALKNAAFTQ